MKNLLTIIAFLSTTLLLSCKAKHHDKKIIIADNSLSKLPDSIFLEDNLEFLSISPEGYTLYPPLSALGNTSLRSMPLNEIPGEIGNLYTLKILSIRMSNIEKLPGSFGKLTNLDTLDLSLNYKLKVINELDKLKALPKLKLLVVFGTDDSEEDIKTIQSTLNPALKIVYKGDDFLNYNCKE